MNIHPKVPTKPRPDSGLTTLEWLLIVAAVAGLAALAVVLVQNVVDETAEEISGSNARITAAQVAAARITSDARNDLPAKEGSYDPATHKSPQAVKQNAVNEEYSSKCNRLEITYSDADVDSKWWPADPSDSMQGTTQAQVSTPNGDHTDDRNPYTTPANPETLKQALCEIARTP